MKVIENLIYFDINDKEKRFECSKLIQAGKLRFYGYATGKLMYYKI